MANVTNILNGFNYFILLLLQARQFEVTKNQKQTFAPSSWTDLIFVSQPQLLAHVLIYKASDPIASTTWTQGFCESDNFKQFYLLICAKYQVNQSLKVDFQSRTIVPLFLSKKRERVTWQEGTRLWHFV